MFLVGVEVLIEKLTWSFPDAPCPQEKLLTISSWNEVSLLHIIKRQQHQKNAQ